MSSSSKASVFMLWIFFKLLWVAFTFGKINKTATKVHFLSPKPWQTNKFYNKFSFSWNMKILLSLTKTKDNSVSFSTSINKLNQEYNWRIKRFHKLLFFRLNRVYHRISLLPFFTPNPRTSSGRTNLISYYFLQSRWTFLILV